MLRAAFVSYLLLLTALGPSLCCCTLKQWASHALGIKDSFACCAKQVAIAHLHDTLHHQHHHHGAKQRDAGSPHHHGSNKQETEHRRCPDHDNCPCKQHGDTPLNDTSLAASMEQHLFPSDSMWFATSDSSELAQVSSSAVYGLNFSGTKGHSFPYKNCRDILRAIQSLRC